MKRIIILFVGVLAALFSSCNDVDEVLEARSDESLASKPVSDVASCRRDSVMLRFAQVLSQAVADRQDVREFLKCEALKKFDKNYDVLYLAVKDELVGGDTFCDILNAYSTVGDMEELSADFPLLNVYLTRTPFLGVYPEEYDVTDAETPVAVPMSDSTRLLVGGKVVDCIAKGLMPGFHVFVVGENTRVVVDSDGCNKSLDGQRFRFKSPAFDGSVPDVEHSLKSVATTRQIVGARALKAYEYFHKDDNSVNQIGLQRDYLYHGLTPTKTQGALVRSVSEYLGFVRINPNAYYVMSDDITSSNAYADPYIQRLSLTKSGSGKWTEAELIERVWTRGAFNLKFEVITSTQDVANVIYVPLTPDQIWTLEYDCSRRHPTKFRHTKYYYTIRPERFKAKDVFFANPIDLGKWNVAEEALYRYIRICEEDKGKEYEVKTTYDMTKANSSNFSGDVKLALGLGKVANVSGGVSTSNTSSNSVTTSKTITEKWTEGADDLGKVKLYYYDPVIDKVEGAGSSSVSMHTYNTGSVEFGLVVK